MISNLTIGDLMIDCANVERTCDFYANLTGWEKTVAYDCLALKADNGLTILFAETDDTPYVPPVWPEEPGEQQKQMHLDFTVDDLPSAVDEAIRFGAVKAATQYGQWYVTMLDPEGHPFCLCQRQGESEFELYFQKKGFDRIPNPSINIDCTDVAVLRGFYANLTSWDQDFHWTALVTEHGMVVHFMECDFDYIPPVWPEEPGMQQKQMHFNFQVDDVQSVVEEAVKLGAAKPAQQFGGEKWVTLLDPEGHPFCICGRE